MDYTTQNKKIELITEDTIVIGVDIGSEMNFARAFDWRGREISKKVFKFSNTLVGFNFFDGWMTDMLQRAAKMQIIVGCEPTGHYWFPLAGHLKDRGILLVTVNPYHVKQTKELDDNSPTKTDLKDPKTIAKLVIGGNYGIPYIPEGIYADLREAISSRDRINKELNASANRIQRWLKIYFPEYLDVYDDWQKDGVQVLKGETGIRTLGSYRYQKEDGSMGMGSKVVKMFDVSQTAIKDFDIEGPSYRKMPEAFMLAFPAAVEVPELPNEEYAFYDPESKLIRVREGLDPATKVFAVAREHAVEIMMGNNYNTREDVIHQAELSAYILTKHYGYDAPDINFGEMSEKYPGKEESEVRGQLGIIKHTAETIDNRVQEALELNRADKYREER